MSSDKVMLYILMRYTAGLLEFSMFCELFLLQNKFLKEIDFFAVVVEAQWKILNYLFVASPLNSYGARWKVL